MGPFVFWRINFRADYFRGRIFPLRGFSSFFRGGRVLWGGLFPPARKGLPWSGFCLMIHCSLSLPVFSRPALCSLWRFFSLHGVGGFLCHQDRVLPLLSSSCFLVNAVIPFTPIGGNDGGQRSSCGAGAGSHFKLSFSLCVRRGKGTAPSRSSLDADIKGLWK